MAMDKTPQGPGPARKKSYLHMLLFNPKKNPGNRLLMVGLWFKW